MRQLRAAFKLLQAIGHLLRGTWTIATRFGSASPEQRSEHIADWSRGLLNVLNVQVSIQGQAHKSGPLLVVLNHISWLDILVMLAAQPVCFVSKSEVRRWPLIGWLATHAGTLYIERSSRRDAMRVVHQVADKLRTGGIVAVFPEGTTTDGTQLLPFHGNLLQSAISASSPVQPVALQFLEQNGHRSMSPVYIDDDTLLTSVWRMVKAKPITAQLDFLPLVSSAGLQRRELSSLLHSTIKAQLSL